MFQKSINTVRILPIFSGGEEHPTTVGVPEPPHRNHRAVAEDERGKVCVGATPRLEDLGGCGPAHAVRTIHR